MTAPDAPSPGRDHASDSGGAECRGCRRPAQRGWRRGIAIPLGGTPRGVRRALVLLLRGYQRGISPLLPPLCRFYPTCSQYALEALAARGVWAGLRLAAWRILRCNPFSRGGFDPVPPRRS